MGAAQFRKVNNQKVIPCFWILLKTNQNRRIFHLGWADNQSLPYDSARKFMKEITLQQLLTKTLATLSKIITKKILKQCINLARCRKKGQHFFIYL